MCEDVRVAAIDPGYRNFAWCVVDACDWRTPVVWMKEDLWKPKAGRRQTPSKDDIVQITKEWIRTNYEVLSKCDKIVIEAQIRVPFIVMASVIQGAFYHKAELCSSVSPMTVGAFFKLPVTRAEKKLAGIAICKQFATIDEKATKLDDLADTWLMAIWLLVQNNALSAKEFDFLPTKKRKNGAP